MCNHFLITFYNIKSREDHVRFHESRCSTNFSCRSLCRVDRYTKHDFSFCHDLSHSDVFPYSCYPSSRDYSTTSCRTVRKCYRNRFLCFHNRSYRRVHVMVFGFVISFTTALRRYSTVGTSLRSTVSSLTTSLTKRPHSFRLQGCCYSFAISSQTCR